MDKRFDFWDWALQHPLWIFIGTILFVVYAIVDSLYLSGLFDNSSINGTPADNLGISLIVLQLIRLREPEK